jgi:hypothetical protein
VTAVTPVELLELPLRRISADTSVLEMSYRSFAPACLVSGTDGRPEGPGGPWLASLRTAALRPDVILRDGGRSIGCAEARQGLVARADALKAGLDDAAATAREAGIPDPAWRRLLAAHDLAVWDGY